MKRDFTAYNWPIIRNIYAGWVEFRHGALYNVRLPERHFQALVLAARAGR